MTWLKSLGGKALALAAAAAIVAALLLWGPAACTSLFTAKKEAEVRRGQGSAAIESGAAAMNIVSTVEANAQETRVTVKEGEDAIQAAPSGDSNDAADRALCSMRSYRNHERCARLRGAHSPIAP
jgi:hypothetical protein